MKRDCHCPRANHQHGTYGAYKYDRCRCPDCSLVNLRAGKAWRLRYDRARRAGQPVGLVPGCGTQRRLRALAVNGWSTNRLAAELGITQQRVNEIQKAPEGTKARAASAVRIAAVYDRLWNVRPTWPGASYARNNALRLGWHPPLAYDDDTIDDPDAQPWTAGRYIVDLVKHDRIDEIAVHRIMVGTLTIPAGAQSPERIEAIRRLHDRKLTDSEIGRRLEMTKDAVHRARKYHGIGREAAA